MYYPYPPPWWPYPWYMLPSLFDPLAMLYTTAYALAIPYYYALMFEAYRAALVAWRKALEAVTKTTS